MSKPLIVYPTGICFRLNGSHYTTLRCCSMLIALVLFHNTSQTENKMSLVVFTLLLDCLPSYPSNIIQMLRGTIGNMPSRELRTATQNLKVEERLYDGTWELLDM